MATETFQATYVREAARWLVTAKRGRIVEAASGRTLERARANITATLAKRLGTYPGHVSITDDFELADKTLVRLEEARSARNAAIAAAEVSRTATSAAVEALLREGLSMRDCAYLLGLSHSRVQQIIEELERGGTG